MVDEDDKLDLSALDPSARDPARWQRVLDETVARAAAAGAARRRRLAAELTALSRPAMLLAAAAVLLVWSASWLAPRPSTQLTVDPTAKLVEWSTSATPPDSGEILITLGGSHER